MKRCFTILMCVYFTAGALMPRSDFSQLISLYDLIDHYNLHAETYTNGEEMLSILDFIKDHYVGDSEHEHDEEEHEDLPFKSLNVTMDYYFIAVQALSCHLSEQLNSVSVPRALIPDSYNVFNIFHPPRSA